MIQVKSALRHDGQNFTDIPGIPSSVKRFSMQINSKLGGINQVVPDSLPWPRDEPYILMGKDPFFWESSCMLSLAYLCLYICQS